MRIVELILDEAQSMMGIEAISIVENPAIEENFLALKSDEIKLAEVNKEKKILMGALLIPNKPIYRKSGKDEYYTDLLIAISDFRIEGFEYDDIF